MAERDEIDWEYEERARILDAWTEKQRQIAVLQSECAELLIERIAVYESELIGKGYHRDAVCRSMIAEHSAAGRISYGTMEALFIDGRLLRDSLPAVRTSFADGRITAAHVREIVRASSIVLDAVESGRADAAIVPLYEEAALVVAERDTAARTKPHAQQVAAALAGESVVETHQRAEHEREVTIRSVGDGLALLTAVLPEWIAAAIMERLNTIAKKVKAARGTRDPHLDPCVLDSGGDRITPDDIAPDDSFVDRDRLWDEAWNNVIVSADGTFALDPDADVEHLPADDRTLDQIRADIFSDMLLTADPSAANGDGLENVHAHIQVTLAATTLAGDNDAPAELDGYGPLDPRIARALAGRNDGWARLFLDASGMVVSTDSYTPTAAMKRHLRARDIHCRFPGCRRPAHRCQIDHNHDHAKGGATAIDNLSHFCTNHHALKHPDVPDSSRWTAQQRPDGTVTWFSPLGRAYDDHPPRRVMFV